jgi:hypothetical protein
MRPAINVTLRGNIYNRWASTGGAGTSSSRGKAITRRGTCTSIATAGYREMGSGQSEPMTGAATRRILELIAGLEAEGLL